ncbi:MAG TPA: 2,3-bisphosphoglycerate-independent phosphoglycerate mutase [Chthoniobacterales bacterium]|jgi:2,3-bisphosphoglycerate-independent phosphoglycerate mutase
MSKPVILIIRDGWGINPNGKAGAEADGNATLLAKTPFHDHLYATYPGATLSASGMDVGLPDGQMGNSEVGHLNLGAGRIVYQDLTRINKAIADGELAKNPVLLEAFEKAKGSRLHFIGLASDGGVHSHQDHLVALAKVATDAGVNDILVHAIADGRDTSPTGGAGYLATIEEGLKPSGAKIATVIGRYFAMDRDKRWERNKLAWDAIVLGKGTATELSPSAAIQAAYAADPRGDEFLQPLIFCHADEQRMRDGDVLIWLNFRADRARQLTEAFMDPAFNHFETTGKPKFAGYYTLTEYKESYTDFGVKAILQPASMEKILGEVVSAAGLKQLRAAETEKFPHVTFFFNGGADTPFAGEDRYLTLSPKTYSKDGKEAPLPTYDLMPQMSAPDLAFEVTRRLENYDMVIVNFANPDMVGHTGVVEAGIHAVETIDRGVKMLVERALELGGKLIITADHGNCELMRNPDGSPNTAHTTNLVHCLYVANDAADCKVEDGILADIAPTLLALLGVAQPPEMTGHSLVSKK